VLEVAVENLSLYFPWWLARNQTLPASGACKAYVMCGACDSLSSPPFLPLRVISQARPLVSSPTAVKVVGRTGRSACNPECGTHLNGRRKIPWLETWDSKDA